MENNLDKTAFELFRQWTKNASIDYPDLNFTIIDERILLKDLKNALRDAINTLVKSEKANQRSIQGYDYGFVLGFIIGNINTNWAFEYITKQSNEFRSFMVNKTLYEYLKYDANSLLKIKTLYERMYENTLNIQDLDYSLPKITIKEFETAELQANDFIDMDQNPVMIYLKNQFSNQLFNLIHIKTKNYLPNLNKFFDEDFVNELIQHAENHEN
ncbi:MAG: hypothetical protein LAT76_11280 [Schleiferiaceae bacterium]|nr:hypothetical protein [Schleiferiaceae bacterium]